MKANAPEKIYINPDLEKKSNMALTITEAIADKEQQLSKCPCSSCVARLDYDMDDPIGVSNDWEVLYPASRPVYFFCAIKKIELDTDKMKRKQCNYQNKSTERRRGMTDKVQKIREEVERLQNELIQEKEKGFGSDVDNACILELQNVLTYIDSMQEEPISKEIGDYDHKAVDEALHPQLKKEPVSEELEKVALEWFNSVKYKSDLSGTPINAFKAGAKWQKEQMMAKAIDAHCFGFQGAALFSFKLPADKYLVSSEVKIIVVNEN